MRKLTQHTDELAAVNPGSQADNGVLPKDREAAEAVVGGSSNSMLETEFQQQDLLTKKNVTILLSDLRGFSEIAEYYTGVEVISMLNRYFESMGDVISAYGGHIDKLMGDSILVVFGNYEERPDDVENALACAVEMQLAMTELNERNRAQGMPDLYMGIAVNTGPVVAGKLGCQQYYEYTVIGEEVNLTSRIEAHCLRGQILISENTYKIAREYIEVGELTTIEVKGIHEAVDLYELHATARPHSMVVPRRDRRKSPRITVHLPFRFQCLSGKIVRREKYQGVVFDIGYNGLLIETETPLAQSSEIKIALSLELFGDRATDIYARIIKTEEVNGKFRSSLEFTTIAAEGLEAIKRYVDKLVEST